MKMLRSTNATTPTRPPRREQGVAAIEFALILTLVALLITVPVYFAKVFSHYSVAQKAARDAAIFVSTVPLTSMSTKEGADAAVAAAREIIAAEVADLHPGMGQSVAVEILCDNGECGAGRPANVMVRVKMTMKDDSGWAAPLGALTGVDLSAVVELRYLGK